MALDRAARYARRAHLYERTRAARLAYLDGLHRDAGREAPPTLPSLAVLSLSGERDLAEQAASVRSFLRHAGVPASWTIVSDGTHRPGSVALLRRLHLRVRVVRLEDVLRPDLPAAVAAYAAAHPMGRKLAFELSMPVEQATLYADADVLFFPGARELAVLATDADGRPRCLRDCGRYVDERLVSNGHPDAQLNGGLFLLRRPLDWRPAMEALRRLRGTPGFFSEQTLLQLAMAAAGAQPLDPARYVVSRADELADADLYAGPEIALRHYTTPVRHKLWDAVERFGA